MTWLIMTTTLSKIILLTLPLPIFPLSPLIHHRTYPLISSLTPIQCLFPCQVSEVSLLMPRNEHDAFPPSLSSLSHPHIPLLLFVSLIAFCLWWLSWQSLSHFCSFCSLWTLAALSAKLSSNKVSHRELICCDRSKACGETLPSRIIKQGSEKVIILNE